MGIDTFVIGWIAFTTVKSLQRFVRISFTNIFLKISMNEY